MKRNLCILGSTGSIGTQALRVARENGFAVSAVCANKNSALVETQAREFGVKYAAMQDETAARDLKTRLADTNIKVLSGKEGVLELCAIPQADTVLNSVVGIAGLKPTLTAIENGKDIALANKETLVTGGEIVMSAAREKGVKILPVDSEHSAIFQCLEGAPAGSLKKILLTASGGPFFGKTRDELKNVTPEMALKHPNWSMGAKITVDSATLMNKGLEVIEAVHLFGVSADDIEVLIHRQSIVHSAVELTDGAVIAQLGTPDMKLPIQYALTYPERAGSFGSLDLFKVGALTFDKPDTDTFRCLQICTDAIRAGGLKPVAANGANEAAVELYLNGKIGFLDIAEIVGGATENAEICRDISVDAVFEADKAAREYAYNYALR